MSDNMTTWPNPAVQAAATVPMQAGQQYERQPYVLSVLGGMRDRPAFAVPNFDYGAPRRQALAEADEGMRDSRRRAIALRNK